VRTGQKRALLGSAKRAGANARGRVEREFGRKIVLQSLLKYYMSELRLSVAAD